MEPMSTESGVRDAARTDGHLVTFSTEKSSGQSPSDSYRGLIPQAPRSQDPLWVRIVLTSVALLALTVLVIIPLLSVFYEAFADGLGAYWKNLTADPDTRNSILLTLTVAPVAVMCNLLFGV